jgi:hypothetical protein
MQTTFVKIAGRVSVGKRNICDEVFMGQLKSSFNSKTLVQVAVSFDFHLK